MEKESSREDPPNELVVRIVVEQAQPGGEVGPDFHQTIVDLGGVVLRLSEVTERLAVVDENDVKIVRRIAGFDRRILNIERTLGIAEEPETDETREPDDVASSSEKPSMPAAEHDLHDGETPDYMIIDKRIRTEMARVAERMLLFLLDQPGQRYDSLNNTAGKDIADILEVSITSWGNAMAKLRGEDYVWVAKKNHRRISAVGLRDDFEPSSKEEFFTERVMAKMAQVDAVPQMTENSGETDQDLSEPQKNIITIVGDEETALITKNLVDEIASRFDIEEIDGSSYVEAIDELIKRGLVRRHKYGELEEYGLTLPGRTHYAQITKEDEEPPFLSDSPSFLESLGEEGATENMVKPYEGEIDEERLESLGKLRYQSIQYLYALDFFGGDIVAKSPNRLLHEYVGDTRSHVDTFHYRSRMLDREGLVVKDTVGRYGRVTLTDLGREYVSQLKARPEIFAEAKRPAEKTCISTSYQILEYVLERASYTNGSGIKWLAEQGSQIPIVPFLANEIGTTRSTMNRRIHALREDKKYLVSETEISGGPEITNIGLTAEGIEYLERLQERLKSKDKLNDDEELDYAMELTQTGIELADATQSTAIAEELRQKTDSTWLTGLSKVGLEEHIFWLEKRVDRLRNEYLFENS